MNLQGLYIFKRVIIKFTELSCRNAGQNDEPKGQIRSEFCDPDGVERILQLDATLAHVKHKQTNAAKQDNGQIFPIGQQAVRLSHSVVTDQVLAGKYQPENGQVRVENSLLYVIEQVEPGHLVGQCQVFQR